MYRLSHDFSGKPLKNVRISNTTFIGDQKNLILHDHIFIGHYNFIEASNQVEIGEGVQITNYVSVTTHSSHQSIRIYGRQYGGGEMKGYIKGAISIGAFTFIGPHVVIMPGSRIGKGCIVKAFSMVKGEFPDYSIIGGNPAKVTGDTRDFDREYLKDPELLRNYNEWTNQ